MTVIPRIARTVRSLNKGIAQAPRLLHDLGDELRQTALDRRRTFDAEGKCPRNKPDEHQTMRIAVVEASAVEQVRDPDLVGREPVANRRGDVFSRKKHQGAGRLVGTDGVHEDHIA
jgi:hypothetical protein